MSILQLYCHTHNRWLSQTNFKCPECTAAPTTSIDIHHLISMIPPTHKETIDYLAECAIKDATQKRTISYSQIVNWQRCRQRWWYAYEEDLTSKEKSIPLMVGDVTHRLREKFLKNELSGDDMAGLVAYVQDLFPEQEPEHVVEIALQAATLVNVYIQQYEEDGTVQITSPEVHLVKDMGEFILYARIDGLAIVKDINGIWREELKTTGRYDSYYVKGLRAGLQTGISLWLMEELMDEDVRGTVFSLLVKTKVPQVYITPVPKVPSLIEVAKQTVHGEVAAMKRGNIWKSGQCHQYNRECGYAKICKNDTPANRKAFYTSRSKMKERSQEIK